jgi:hypothetical protein
MGKLLVGVAATVVLVLGLMVAGLSTALVGGGPPGVQAQRDIPPALLPLYQAAADSCPGLPWSVLAGIGKVESDHGRSTAPGVTSGANFAGAAGPMQIGIGGKAGNTFGAYAVDGDGEVGARGDSGCLQPTVVRLDLADGGQHRPGQPGAGVGGRPVEG